MNRREFMSWVGVGGIASSLPVALVACSPKAAESPVESLAKPAAESSVAEPRSDGFQLVGTMADLERNGQIVNEKFAAGSLLVIQDPADKTQLIAVNSTCSHADCAVAWQKEQSAFVCPCHDSRFSSTGTVQKGPADQPLATYKVKLENDSVLVKAS